MRKLTWVIATTALAALLSGCAAAEIANVADHAAEIDAARVAEISAADTVKVGVPADTGIDAAAEVSTAYGDVPPQDADGLNQSAADEASAVSDATRSVATSPSTGAVDSTIQEYVTKCVKEGFSGVANTYFDQWLNGQYDFNSIMSSGISACLSETFPGVDPQLISELSDKLVATIDPSTAQAEQNSPTPGVFHNWLLQAGS